MSKKTKIISIVVVLAVCAATVWHSKRRADMAGKTIPMCFIWHTEDGSSANLVVDVIGEMVTGKFEWNPAEKDKKTGPFTGILTPLDADTKMLDAFWTATAEGTTTTEELKVKISGGIAQPGFGKMKEGDDVLVYADPDSISYEPNLSLIDCELEYVN